MGPIERASVLERWMGRESEAEELRMARADRMVNAAIDKHPAFDDYRHDIVVYAKGSYANQTNVRLDSDVDIVIENRDLYYYQYRPATSAPSPDPYVTPYRGRWNDPAEWRAEVVAALKSHFTASQVDTSGKVAINIAEVPGSRPSIDVVPAFEFRRFDAPDHSDNHTGSRVFATDGTTINNFPEQQKVNGDAKDRRTSGRYKMFVRALKSAENVLAENDTIKDLPSYFMECLVYNVPDRVITSGATLDANFRATLVYLLINLIGDDYVETDWEEPNGLKYLFRGHEKWSHEEGCVLAASTLRHLGYIS